MSAIREALSSTPNSVVAAINQRAEVGQKTLSFEFFPPKDEDAAVSLWRNYSKLLEVSPDFVSVTYGAGGSNRETSLGVVDRMAKDVLTIGHLTCVGSTNVGSREIIKHFEQAGVGSILALRGDSPRDQPDALEKGELKTAIELVELVRAESSLEVGVAAFPEKHPESPSLHHDADVLALKQNAGASYAMTQLFFTVDAYLELQQKASLAGTSLPIIPGVMPISNASKVLRMAEMSGAAVPSDLLAKLQNADEHEARIIGMDYSVELANDLLAAGAPGLHIFTLNFSKAAIEVAKGCGLA
ncbi:MAG: methylenetetrahydrofolate reductase [Rhodoluna sp.]|nr:methylenetetrahydrofolate reductase [Rhodoluna sp.]MBP6186306.1 methylenetetrahydrofolate reductase [Rhodoluna sp.]